MEVMLKDEEFNVETIPPGWSSNTIGNLCTISSGTTPSRSDEERYYSNGTIYWVKTGDLTNSKVSLTEELVTKTALDETSLRIYPVGTVLVAMYGGFNQIGRTGLLTVPAAVNQAITAIQTNPKALVSEYLLNVLNYRINYWKTVASSSRKDPNITSYDIKQFPISFPNHIKEQQAIATALSDVDTLITSLDKLIAKKRDIKQATMQQLLTGKTRLPGFSGTWEMKKLEDMGICLRGVSYNGDNDLSLYDTDDTIRLLRSNNVQNANIIKHEVQFVTSARVATRQILQENDILICMANGSKELVGKAGAFRADGIHDYTFGAFMACFRTNLVAHPTFVFFLFQTSQYRNYIVNLLAGSSINNLKPSDVESMQFSFPKFEEQQAIATVLSDMDAEIAALEQRREKTRMLKQGMMQELLTGKTRLI